MTKGKIVKKIFATIGIVVGGALALAGAIIGIFAAMGKFKEPVVYPETLVFEQSVLMIDQNNPAITLTSGKKIYSFVLTGKSSEEYAVNKKLCYLSFSKGKDIITLCSKDGTPLTPSQSNGNQYLVNCNEPVYYFVNTQTTVADGEFDKVGTVVLSARDERGAVWGSNELTINVDSKIEVVYVDATRSENGVLGNSTLSVDGQANQEIEMSLGGKVYINNENYNVKPSNALKPFTGKDGKEIELYFVGNEKYFLVNSETLETDTELKQELKDASGNSIIQYDEHLGYYFTSMVAGNYQFKIAYFPTYNEKELFDSEPLNAQITGYDRVQEMRYTNLTFSVVNTTVNDVKINGSVNLDLFLDNNYLTLGAQKTVETGKSSMLDLTYNPDNEQTKLRYNESTFVKGNNLNLNNVFALTTQTLSGEKIVSVANQKVTQSNGEYSFVAPGPDNTNITFGLTAATLNGSPINLGYYETIDGVETFHNRILVNSISNAGDNTETYNATGMLVIDGIGDDLTIKLLPAGTYIDFFKKSTINEIEFSSIWQNYEAEFYNRNELTGKRTTWKILVKEDRNDVVLGALVVNNDGTSHIAHVSVNILPVELTNNNLVLKNDGSHNLTIKYDNVGNVDLKDGSSYLNMNEIFEIPNDVTYKNAVLLTEETDNYNFDVVPNLTVNIAGDLQNYALVGYIDETTGKFVNRVRVNKNSTKESVNVYVAQLKTGFNVTTEEYAKDCIENPKSFEIAKLFKDKYITINVAYDISALTSGAGFNEELVEVKFEGCIDGEEDLSYKTGEMAAVSISMLKFKDGDEERNPQPDIVNIFTNLRSMLGNDFVELFTFAPANVEDLLIEDIENGVKLTFTIGSVPPNGYMDLTMNYNGTIINIDRIFVKSKSPTHIKFDFDGNTEEIILSSDSANPTECLIVEIGWNGTDYTYAWKYGETSLGNNFVTSDEHFKLYPSYSEGTITYAVDNAGILSVDADGNAVVNGVGECVLQARVENSSAVGYLKVVVTQDGKFKLDVANQEPAGTVCNLNGIYTYDKQDLDDRIEILNIISEDKTHQFSYKNNKYILYKENEDNTILEVTYIPKNGENGGYWQFARTSDLYSSLSLKVQIKTKTNTTKEIDVVFNPSLAVNKNWKNATVYAGTIVALYGTVSNNTQTTNAMFKIVNSTAETVQIELSHNGNSELLNNEQQSLEVGVYLIKFYIEVAGAEIVLGTFPITVVPNAIINVTNTSFTAGKSGQTMFEAYSYRSKDEGGADIVYGSTTGEYPSINSQNFASFTQPITSDLTSSDSSITFATDISQNINIPASYVKEIGGRENPKIKLFYKSVEIPKTSIFDNKSVWAGETNEIQIEVGSAYTVKNFNGEIEVVEDNVIEKFGLTIKDSEENIVDKTNISIEIVSITDKEGEVLTVESGKISTLVSKYMDCEISLNVTISGSIYKLSKELVVKPYIPLNDTLDDEIERNTFIYSEMQYDLIERVFVLDPNISSITATKIIDAEGTEYDSMADIPPFFSDFAFASNDNKCSVKTSQLNGDDAKVTIVFEITYSTGETYTYEHELTIKNRDQFEPVVYPYADIKMSGEEALIEYNSTAYKNGTLSYKVFSTIEKDEYFEPVVVGQTIDLAEKINDGARVNISDKAVDPEQTEKIVEIVPYATTNYSSMLSYVYDLKGISISGTKITFKSLSSSLTENLGYIQFKFTTTHGNIGYYNVKLYDSGLSEIVKQNIQVTSTSNRKFAIDNNGYKMFGTELNLSNTFDMNAFDSTKVSMYLLSVTSPASAKQFTEGVYVGEEWLLSAKWFEKLNGVEIKQINQYATIKVALVYSSGNTFYPFGTLTIFVQPENHEGNPIEDSGLADKVIKMKSGVYTKTINHNASEFLAPFNDVSTAKFEDDYTGTAIAIDTTSTNENKCRLQFNEYVKEDLTFTVQYTLTCGLLINVEYTYLGFKFTPTTQSVTVGTFNQTDKVFNNKLSLDDILDGYSKAVNIKIDNTVFATNIVAGAGLSEGKTYEKEVSTGEKENIEFKNDSEQNITFPLFSIGYDVVITLDFGSYGTKTVNVHVLPGIYVENKTTTTPIDSTFIDESFSKVDGSDVKFEKGTIPKYNTLYYTLGNNFTVYMANSGALNFAYTSENGVNYVMNGTTFTIDEDGAEITFPHMARADKVVDLGVTFTYNDKSKSQYQYNGTTNDEGATLKVKLAKTYSGLHFNYLQEGADNENVIKDDWTKEGETVYSKFFTDSATQRVSLLDVSKNLVDDGSVNFTQMGFETETNPNYMRYQPGEDMVLVGGKLSFNAVEFNKETILKLTNNAGCDHEYKFYLMKSAYNKVDGIDFSYGNVSDTNASFVVGDNYGNLSKTALGTLTDGGNSKNVYSINVNSVEVDKEDIVSGKLTLTLDEDTDNSKDFVFKYSIKMEYGTFVLTLSDNKVVSVEFNSAKTFNKLSLKLSLTGDTDYILKEFDFILYNYKEPSAEKLSTSVWATSTFNVADYIAWTNPDGTPITSALTYELTGAKYVGGPNNGDDVNYNNGSLINLNGGVVKTYNVPDDTRIKLTYDVKDDSTYIKTIDFTLTIKNSIVYVVNGKKLDSSIGETSFTTDYNLYNAEKTSGKFPLTQSLQYDSVDNNDNKLSLRLFSAAEGYLTDTDFIGESGVPLSEVSIGLKDGNKNEYYNYVSINGTDLIFNKDLTTASGRPLVLTITRSTNNGYYIVDWNINVTGLLQVKYVDGATENDVLAEQPSGGTVTLTNPQYDSNDKTNNIYIEENVNGETIEITPTIDYVITQNSIIDNVVDLFVEGYTTLQEQDYKLSGRQIRVILPVVPQGAAYTVTYRIKVSYMGRQQGPFYVSYLVRNSNRFETLATSVNVDDSDFISTPDDDLSTPQVEGEIQLKIFAYIETYKEGTTDKFNIVPGYNRNEYVMHLKYDDKTYTKHSGSLAATSQWICGEEAIELKNNGSNSYSFREGVYASNTCSFNADATITTLTRSVDCSGTIIDATNYINIEEFVNTINEITLIKFANLSAENGYAGGGTGSYTLKYSDGRYFYIDLKENLGSSKLFNGTLTADLQVFTTTPIFTINGFELTTSKTISANGEELTLRKIFKSSQYTSANSAYAGTKLLGVFDDSKLSGKLDENGVVADSTLKDKLATWVTGLDSSNYTITITKVAGFTKMEEATTGSFKGDYQLYSIKYSSGSATLYNVQAEFYAIGSSTGDITVVDYATNSLNPDSFYVEYVENDGTTKPTVTINAIATYKMENGSWNKVSTQKTFTCPFKLKDGATSNSSTFTTRMQKDETTGLTINIEWQIPDNWE